MGIKERKDREKEHRREQIIEAGEKIFLKKGLHGTTMDEIARVCELSKGTLYLYFTSKEQLYLHILHRAMTIMQTMMFEYQNAIDDPVLRLEKIGDAYFDFYREYPEHFKLLAVFPDPEQFDAPDLQELGTKLECEGQQVWMLMTEIIKEGTARGIFRTDIDPMEVSISLWGIMTHIITVMDHMKKIPDAIPEMHRPPIAKVDFVKAIEINLRRIMYSILKDPPGDFDFYGDAKYGR